MPNFAHAERLALCRTLLATGPDAPTLCGEWTTRDLAAHLVVRESRPDAAAGMFLPVLASRLESVQRSIASTPWEALVDKLRSGPPLLSPFRLPGVDEKANLAEFFVHHEDVLRAGEHGDARRAISDGEQRALWSILPRIGRMTLRNVRTGVVADCAGYGRRTLRSARDDHGSVVLTATPGDVLLYVFGRNTVTGVELDGSESDVAAFRASPLGI
jgi:uncharacterized protein (TIGR03085 family)